MTPRPRLVWEICTSLGPALRLASCLVPTWLPSDRVTGTKPLLCRTPWLWESVSRAASELPRSATLPVVAVVQSWVWTAATVTLRQWTLRPSCSALPVTSGRPTLMMASTRAVRAVSTECALATAWCPEGLGVSSWATWATTTRCQ